jgi:hypothetical protein
VQFVDADGHGASAQKRDQEWQSCLALATICAGRKFRAHLPGVKGSLGMIADKSGHAGSDPVPALTVTPAKAGAQGLLMPRVPPSIPAFAGMTKRAENHPSTVTSGAPAQSQKQHGGFASVLKNSCPSGSGPISP